MNIHKQKLETRMQQLDKAYKQLEVVISSYKKDGWCTMSLETAQDAIGDELQSLSVELDDQEAS
jgi:peptidoglycan hydrolase CwlO-like protein